MLKWLTLLAVLLVVASVQSAEPKKIVCYFGSWAGYRQGDGKFEIEYMQPDLCTHLIYTFVGLSTEGDIKILDSWMDLPDGKDGYGRWNRLKATSNGAKTLIAIGGWNEGSYTYSQVMNNPATRAKFVQNVVAFVTKWGFDGFDIDWEYPGQRGGQAGADKGAYSALVKELRTEFDKHGLILTAAVGVSRSLVPDSYDVKVLSENLDIINFMAYDLHGSWDGFTGENGALYPLNSDDTLNVDSSLKYWIANGANPAKIALGMGTYGHSYTLANQANDGIGALITGPGEAGPLTVSAGMLGYNEICTMINNGGWKQVRDDTQKVPYIVKGSQWVGYDDVESIKLKAQYALDHGLGGAMIWSIETDDFRGTCNNKKFPLLSAINEVFGTGRTGAGGGPLNPTTSKPPTTSGGGSEGTTSTTSGGGGTTAGPIPNGVCKTSGFVRDPTNCAVFYECDVQNGVYVATRFSCGAGTYFDTTINSCNFIDQVQC